MKLQMELFTDLYGVFAVPTNGRIHQKNRNCLYRRRNRGFDPGRIRMVDMKNKFYGEHDHG